MLLWADPVVTSAGVSLYRDDGDSRRFHLLPERFEPRARADGGLDFTLLFHQSDAPERGARLTATFVARYPSVAIESVPELAGIDAHLVPAPSLGGEARVSWEGVPDLAPLAFHGEAALPVEATLSRDQARSLRSVLRAGDEGARVSLVMAFEAGRKPRPARLRVNLQALARFLAAVEGPTLSGGRLAELLLTAPGGAVRLEPTDAAAAELDPITAAIAAPILAGRIARAGTPRPLFAFTTLTLLEPEVVPAGELAIDLSRARSWQQAVPGEWSLSAFYRWARQERHEAEYFPEVLHVPPVGRFDIFVQNLLPVDGRCFDRVRARLSYPQLGSQEKVLFETVFYPGDPPVVRRSVQRIAFTDFRFEHQTWIRIPADPPHEPQPRWIPADPPWIETADPSVEIDSSGLAFLLAYVAADADVFQRVAAVALEIAPASEEDPTPAVRIELDPSERHRWLRVDRSVFASRRLRWRPVLYPRAPESGGPVTGGWQDEGSLRAVVTAAHVYPSRPIELQARAIFEHLDEIVGLVCELAVGATPPVGAPDLVSHFSHDETRELVLWPATIFQQGYLFRYGIEPQSGTTEWTPWRHLTETRLLMKPEDDFYATRDLKVRVAAPWSRRAGPDPDSRAGAVIYVEITLHPPTGGPARSTTFTFDRANVEERSWSLRSRPSTGLIRYELRALSEDGRLLTFGPFETTADRIAVELYVTRVSDTAPAEFDVRSQQVIGAP